MFDTLSDFDFDLPETLIAQNPANPRDSARLLDASSGIFSDRIMRDLPSILRLEDLLVVNNTQVLPAQLYGRKGEGAIGFTLHQRISANSWRAFAKPAKKCLPGTKIEFDKGLSAIIAEKAEAGEVVLAFSHASATLDSLIEAVGQMPLPPYIRRPKGGVDEDKSDYQTIFASHKGAVAAPTAGLHFTPELLSSIRKTGTNIAELTLHVGAGTFLPVKTEKLADHKMHSEWGRLDSQSVEMMRAARAKGGRIICVGTTSLRLVESAFHAHGKLAPFEGETDIFIRPGFRFGVADMLLTNFHLPKSTLLMLVSAFSGYEHVIRLYRHAIENQYRFFSYGDGCLLSCTAPYDR